jgi:hypothetical protein
VTIHTGAAAQAIVRRAIREVHLFHITTGGKVLGSFENLDHAGSALANPSTIVEVIQAFVGIDPGGKRCFP